MDGERCKQMSSLCRPYHLRDICRQATPSCHPPSCLPDHTWFLGISSKYKQEKRAKVRTRQKPGWGYHSQSPEKKNLCLQHRNCMISFQWWLQHSLHALGQAPCPAWNRAAAMRKHFLHLTEHFSLEKHVKFEVSPPNMHTPKGRGGSLKLNTELYSVSHTYLK